MGEDDAALLGGDSTSPPDETPESDAPVDNELVVEGEGTETDEGDASPPDETPGDPADQEEETYKKRYADLQRKLGEQGTELGELRKRVGEQEQAQQPVAAIDPRQAEANQLWGKISVDVIAEAQEAVAEGRFDDEQTAINTIFGKEFRRHQLAKEAAREELAPLLQERAKHVISDLVGEIADEISTGVDKAEIASVISAQVPNFSQLDGEQQRQLARAAVILAAYDAGKLRSTMSAPPKPDPKTPPNVGTPRHNSSAALTAAQIDLREGLKRTLGDSLTDAQIEKIARGEE